MNDIIQTIQTVGFPISACVALGFYVKYITDKNDAKIENLEKTHGDALEKITEALNNNTIALTKLAERLGGDDNDGE